MTKHPGCRLLLDTEPHSGAWNMAVDETLLERAASDELATFRWYRWSEPTLSLGYFQHAEEVLAEPNLNGLPIVRRLTGGGAILHDQEWTYSVAVPARQDLFRLPEELYDLVHQAMIDVLVRKGCRPGFRGETVHSSSEPVLCFSRQDAHDVVWNGSKILGSAQRRRKGAVLQHGSLLLQHAAQTPQHSGLLDLGLQTGLSLDDLRNVPSRLFNRVDDESLTRTEVQQIERIIAQANLRGETKKEPL